MFLQVLENTLKARRICLCGFPVFSPLISNIISQVSFLLKLRNCVSGYISPVSSADYKYSLLSCDAYVLCKQSCLFLSAYFSNSWLFLLIFYH